MAIRNPVRSKNKPITSFTVTSKKNILWFTVINVYEVFLFLEQSIIGITRFLFVHLFKELLFNSHALPKIKQIERFLVIS